MSFAYMTGDTAGHWCVVLFYRGHYGLVVKTPAGWRIQQWCMTADGDGQSLISGAESR